MTSDIEYLIHSGRKLVDRSIGLDAADQQLSLAQEMMAHEESSGQEELAFLANRLRGDIAQFNANVRDACIFYDRARALARSMGRKRACAEITLQKSYSAVNAGEIELASIWLSDAAREIGRVSKGRPDLLIVNFLSLQAKIAEAKGDLNRAEFLMSRNVPESARLDNPDGHVARHLGWANLLLRMDGAPTRRVENLLQEAGSYLPWTRHLRSMREMQWHTTVGYFLLISGDKDGAESEIAKAQQLITRGRFVNSRFNQTRSLLHDS
jgi:hypothetical protein